MINKNENHITDIINSGDIFSGFKSDRERIRYISKKYANISIAESFAKFYSIEVPKELKKNKTINSVINITVGEIYTATVKTMSKHGITFTIPGVKEELYTKENFADCIDNFKNYLINHNDQVLIEIREKKDNKYLVSIINAYYKTWQKEIEKAIAQENGLEVHINSLVRGGYLCSTPIWPINEITGKNYSSSVFIPGSHIVLNIEHNFEQWIGKDVTIVPQKFAKFRPGIGQPVENSIVGSRKRILQIEGMVNMYNIYSKTMLANKPGIKYTPEIFEGTVTGIINSNKNTGVFIEIEDQFITGLLPVNNTELLNYKPGDKVNVCVKEFECQEGKEPFQITRGNRVVRCNVRPVFKLA